MKTRIVTLIALSALSWHGVAWASASHKKNQNAPSVCVFDVMGHAGETVGLLRDFALDAKSRGVNLQIQVYRDEGEAKENFDTGKCQAVVLPDFGIRDYNHFVSSISAIGAIQTNQLAHTMIRALSAPKAATHMLNQQYEVAGIIPVGAVYVMTNDRRMKQLSHAQGKRFVALKQDPVYARIINAFGAVPIEVSLADYGRVFNEGGADIIAAPAILFKPLELHKGIGSTGAIARYPVTYITLNMVIRHQAFPEGFGQQSRTWFAGQVPRLMNTIQALEKQIPAQLWMDISVDEQNAYGQLLFSLRRRFLDEGTYDRRMLQAIQRTQCVIDPKHVTCALSKATPIR
ncbi:MAG: putative solute-binding protein [Pseudomonadota bacterium]|nr:putative solute-binding protein [Pseudomonadota bacterium]